MDIHVYACDEVQEIERLHHDLLAEKFRRLPIREQLDRQAHRMLEAHQAGNKAVVTHVKCWHPQLVGHSDEEIMSGAFALDDARQTIAREYGFADWDEVQRRGAEPPQCDFELAAEAPPRSRC